MSLDPALHQAVVHVRRELDRLAPGHGSGEVERRSPSRWAGQGADRSYVEQIASRDYTLIDQPTVSGRGHLALHLKALAEGTGTAGGVLVPREVATEVMPLLRARSAVLRLGPTVVPV